jgi:signal peptidase II
MRRRTIAGIKKFLILIIIALVVIIADQVTKYLVTTGIPVHRGVEIIPGFANLVHVRNPGAAFGIFADSTSNLRAVFLLLVSVAALVCIIWTVVASKQIDSYLLAGLSFFFGGATGNLVDRLRFGEVIDFVDVYVGSFHWPAFNVADASLCVGTGLLFLHFLLRKDRT